MTWIPKRRLPPLPATATAEEAARRWLKDVPFEDLVELMAAALHLAHCNLALDEVAALEARAMLAGNADAIFSKQGFAQRMECVAQLQIAITEWCQLNKRLGVIQPDDGRTPPDANVAH